MRLPEAVDILLKPESMAEIHIGESKSRVFEVAGKSGEDYFLKISDSRYVQAELYREVSVLSWLGDIKIPCPKTVAFVQDGDFIFFLMTAVPGRSLSDSAEELGVNACMMIGAEFLRKLHSIDIENCPFDRNLTITRKLAFENLKMGLVDVHDFDFENQGKPVGQLYSELNTHIEEELVFTHGDYCFPNIICADGRVSGVVDLGRAGVADRYQDIALFLRSFKFNVGEPDLQLFLKYYGLIDRIDNDKAAFYRKLDEFF